MILTKFGEFVGEIFRGNNVSVIYWSFEGHLWFPGNLKWSKMGLVNFVEVKDGFLSLERSISLVKSVKN